ncbi:MAG TPA: helix-turn-helix domain-containing protein [Steroidobacteraceae bacterium]|nr:helix-turn-helix domain-containing protein [Steroidobacteraceae bacterium]
MSQKPARHASIPHRGPLGQRAALARDSKAFPRMKSEAVPRSGWVREIRTALGLSQSQLAARAGVSRATVQQMERAEAERRITVSSLDRLAAAMDCQVAIAILPKNGTLEDVRRRQALAKAEVILHEKVKDNKRPPKPADLERRKQQIVARLLRGSRRRLWKPI